MPTGKRECPDCSTKFTGERCPTCDWQTEPKPEAGKRPGWKTMCEWMTASKRCLIRPSAIVEGGRQYCSWHHTIALMGAGKLAAHFDSYEAWVGLIEGQGRCAMEAHYPARITFAWVCGEAVQGVASPCASSTCSVTRKREDATPSSPVSPSQYRREVAPLVQLVLAGPPDVEPVPDW